MTDPTMAPRALLEKSSDTDPLREIAGFTAQCLMEPEAESLTAVPHGKRSEDRVNPRSGFRDRTWETRAGTIELRVPPTAVRLTAAFSAGNPLRTGVFGRFWVVSI